MTSVNVLLIEQDLSLQMLYSEVLTYAGYKVFETTHNVDIIHCVNMCHPAIALISSGPRGLFRTGWRTAEQLHHAFPRLPLVMIATNSEAVSEVGRTARGNMFVAALQKPFQLDHLLAIVAQYTSYPATTTSLHVEQITTGAEIRLQ